MDFTVVVAIAVVIQFLWLIILSVSLNDTNWTIKNLRSRSGLDQAKFNVLLDYLKLKLTCSYQGYIGYTYKVEPAKKTKTHSKDPVMDAPHRRY